MNDPLVLIVLVPLSGAVATLLLGGRVRTVAAGGVTAATTVAALGLAIRVGESGTLTHVLGGWAAPLGIGLRADGLSAVLVAMTGVVAAVVGIYAMPYFRAAHSADGSGWGRRASWWPIWFFLWGSLNALFVSADIFNLYVTLELVTLSAVALIILGDGTAALAAALRYLLAAFLGSLVYLLGVVLLYGESGTLDIAMLGEATSRTPAATAAVALMTVGLLLKTALFPLHFWLPRAHASAPTPASAALSALVVKASFVIVLRIWFEAAPAVPAIEVAHVVGLLGAIAIVWGSVQAFRARRLKMLIAHSTVAQVGYLFLMLPLVATAAAVDGASAHAWSGGIYQVVSHAFAKSAMFLAAGTLMIGYGHDRIDGLAGAARRLPMTVLAFGIAGVGLIGLPPTGGFVAKFLLLDAAMATGLWPYATVILAGGLFTAAYVFRVLGRAFTGADGDGDARPPEARVPRLLEAAPLALALAGLVLGLGATWPIELLEVGAPLPAIAGAGE
jgi:multicomponent Na+:H+ antiporter subunit D